MGTAKPEQMPEKRPLKGKDSEHTFKLAYFNISYIYHYCEFFKLKINEV